MSGIATQSYYALLARPPEVESPSDHAPPSLTDTKTQENAAVSIQRAFQDYLAQKTFRWKNSFPHCRTLSDVVEKYANRMPKAPSRKSIVYLPEEMPSIVLKVLTSTERAKKCFRKREEVRKVLKSQLSNQVTVPITCRYQNILIQSRVPIENDTMTNMALHSMGKYLAHTSLFDKPVKELIRLFSMKYLSCLITNNWPMPMNEITGDIVRYDNFSFVLETKGNKESAKIVLINSTHFTDKIKKKEIANVLVRIFPFQSEIIQKEALAQGLPIDINELKRARNKGKRYLERCYLHHYIWLKNKGITSSSCSEPLKFDNNIIEKIETAIQTALIQINKEETFRNFIPINTLSVSKVLAHILFLRLSQTLENLLWQMFLQQIKRFGGSVRTDTEMIILRSPRVKRSIFLKEITEELSIFENINFQKKDDPEQRIAERLLLIFMKNLEQEEVIFHFSPGYQTQQYRMCWIQY